MKDEGSAHSKHATEKTGFEDDIVSRRSLTGSPGTGCGLAGCRPVVPCECECGEVDFMRKLDEALPAWSSRIERCRPGLYVRTVFETTRQRLEQLLLLS